MTLEQIRAELSEADWQKVCEVERRSEADDRHLEAFADVERAEAHALALGFLAVSVGEMRDRRARLQRSMAALERARKAAALAKSDFDEAIVVAECAIRLAGESP